MEEAIKLQCVGGWGFLLMAIGIFMLVPSSILMGQFSTDAGTAEQIAAIVLFVCSFVFIIMSIIMTIYYCKASRTMAEKDPESNKSNGHANGSSSRSKPDTNGAAAKYTRSDSAIPQEQNQEKESLSAVAT